MPITASRVRMAEMITAMGIITSKKFAVV